MKKKKQIHKILEYTAIFEKEEKGERYSVRFPSLPGCFTFGNNLKHAKQMAKEVLELWIGFLSDSDKKIPIENKSKEVYISKMKVALVNK